MKQLIFIVITLVIAAMFGVPASYGKAKRKMPAKVTVNTVMNRLDKWGEVSYNQSLAQKLAWSRGFMSNTVAPYVAAKYPSKVSLSEVQKCDLLYSDLKKYITNSDACNANHIAMVSSAESLSRMKAATVLLRISEIERLMVDDASKKAWMDYASALYNLTKKISSAVTDYIGCETGGGSGMMDVAIDIHNNILDGVREILNQDLQVLKGRTISIPSETAKALAHFNAALDLSNVDADILELADDEIIQTVKNAPNEIKRSAERCISRHESWVATLPSDVRSRMVDNLSVLFESVLEALRSEY